MLSDLRFNGFMAGWNRIMDKHPDVTTVKFETKWRVEARQGSRPDPRRRTANPDLTVVHSMNDVMHGGIVQGLQQADLWGDGIIMASYDGGMGAMKAMVDDPKGPLQADDSTSRGTSELPQCGWRWAPSMATSPSARIRQTTSTRR